MGQMTEADRWFERCLHERDCHPGPHEPEMSDHGLMKRPEYVATSAAGDRVGFEVKAFSPKSKLGKQLARQASGAFDGRRLVAPIRNQLGEAAAQLKGLAGKMPLVIVLANPECAHVDLSPEGVMEAMYGDLHLAFPYDSDTGELREGRLELGRDGKFATRHQYVSAVAVLRYREHREDAVAEVAREVREQPTWDQRTNAERIASMYQALNSDNRELPDGEYSYVDVIETMGATFEGPALPLPGHWFDGPLDTRWRHDGVDRFELVRGPERPSLQ